jgi:hypothetical protein
MVLKRDRGQAGAARPELNLGNFAALQQNGVSLSLSPDVLRSHLRAIILQ